MELSKKILKILCVTELPTPIAECYIITPPGIIDYFLYKITDIITGKYYWGKHKWDGDVYWHSGKHEELNRLSEANVYRERMIILDKWNAINYLQLGKNFKALGDSERSQQMLEILNSFASENPIIDQARIELGF